MVFVKPNETLCLRAKTTWCIRQKECGMCQAKRDWYVSGQKRPECVRANEN